MPIPNQRRPLFADQAFTVPLGTALVVLVLLNLVSPRFPSLLGDLEERTLDHRHALRRRSPRPSPVRVEWHLARVLHYC